MNKFYLFKKKKIQLAQSESTPLRESNRISWAPFRDVLQQDTPNGNSDADMEASKVNY